VISRDSESQSLARTATVYRRKPVNLIESGTAVLTKATHGTTSVGVFRSPSGTIYERSLRELVGPVTVEASQDTSWQPAAASRVISRAKGEAVNLAVFLAEYRSTGNQFLSLAKDVVTLTRAVVSRNPKLLLPRKRWDATTTGRWLEYTYGIRPLMGDVIGIHAALRQSSARPLMKQFRDRRTVTTKTRTSKELTALGVVTPNEIVTIDSSTNKYVTHGLITLRNDDLHRYLGQFGFTNPASVAWELVPFSFVADWFINFGDFFASLDTFLYIKEARVGYYMDNRRVVQVLGGDAVYSAEAIYKRRQPLGVTPLVTRLTYEPSLTLSRITSAISLLHQGAWSRGYR